VGKIEALKGIGVHSNRIPAFENLNRSLQARGLLGPYGEASCRGEQQTCGTRQGHGDRGNGKLKTTVLCHDDTHASRLAALQPMAPAGKPRVHRGFTHAFISVHAWRACLPCMPAVQP